MGGKDCRELIATLTHLAQGWSEL